MARQKGIFPIQGSIGNVTFVKSRHGYLAKEKTSIDASRIASAPEFQRTRENNAEFGRAGKAGKLLRDSLRVLIQKCSDSGITGRVMAAMMAAIKLDATSTRGMRNVPDGELEIFQGFEFNEGAKLSSVFYAAYIATIDRVQGSMSVNIPSFKPDELLAYPAGATHFKINIGGAEIDFEHYKGTGAFASSAMMPVNALSTPAINLSTQLTANSTHPLFLALAIEFFQEVNGNYYSLKNGAYNSMALVEVDAV